MHIPVLQKEVIRYLDPKPNENFVDCTFGCSGHSQAILEKIGPRGKVLAIDWSPEMIKETSGNNLILVCDTYSNLKEIVKNKKFSKVKGIFLDLGMSSWHLADSGRGFSFQKKEPLDMRYSLKNQLTAEKIVNYWSKFDVERILEEYGQEQFAGEIAEKIIEERKNRQIKTTSQLAEIVRKAVPKRYLRQRIHFATKTFQALRIATNNELDNLRDVLPQTLEVLEPGGRLAVISFHSLEDKIVKDFFKKPSLKVLTKKPIAPNLSEIKTNPRARSAKLRAAQKL